MTRDPSAVGALEALSWRGWVVLSDLARPGKGRGTYDHVLVGPGGVFVTTRTRWPGPVEVVDGALHLGGLARQREITEVAEAAAEVLTLVPDVPVHPVLCLERHGPVTGWVRNVMLCATSNVEEVLTSRPAVLGPDQVQRIGQVLHSQLEPAPPPATPEPDSREHAPWPLRVLLQALSLALAAVLVMGVLQTRVVDEISAAVDEFVAELSSFEEASKREPEQRDRSTSGSDVEPGQVKVKGRQLHVDKDPGTGTAHADQDGRTDHGMKDDRQGRRDKDQRRSRD